MLLILLGALVLGVLYLRKTNRMMLSQPSEVLALNPKRWTDEEIRTAYKQHCENPLDVKPFLPPKTGNRYIVVGGNGFVGGWTVLHLLHRGEDPSNIRILDIRAPIRKDLQRGPASQVHFVKVDITNLEETKSAFNLPWPNEASSSTPKSSLTVFHTAAVIRFFERNSSVKHLSSRVNVLGTQNVLTAAAATGASYFIYTSSGSIHNKIVNYFVAPWKQQPHNYFQVISESTLIPTGKYCISNYTQSKGDAENAVLSYDGKGTLNGFMRTGALRPGNMIYGSGGDPAIGGYLRDKVIPTWVQNSIQTQVYVENVSIAHLLFEQRLIEDELRSQDRFGGKGYVVTDPNPPITFSDIYRFLNIATNGETRFPELPPLAMLLLAYLVEAYHIFYFRVSTLFPFTKIVLPPLGKNIVNLQPSMFSTSSSHVIFDDSLARKDPKDGGLGYKAPFTSIMGFSKVVHDFLTESGALSGDNRGHTISRAEHGVGAIGSKLGVIEKPQT